MPSRTNERLDADALVVGGDQVVMLDSAQRFYQAAVERMQQGAVTAAPDGKILFANQRFSDMIGMPLAQLYTAPLETYVRMGDRARVSSFLMISARDSQVDIELVRADGSGIPARLSLASFADVYINDAFGAAHRAHASIVGIPKFVKTAAAGYLMKKEIEYLQGAVADPIRPFVAILGAATSQISYTASKGAVLSLSRELAVQFAREGVRVNALCPGPVETPLLLNIYGSDPAALERRRIHWPTGRLAKPREIVNAALFLASDESSYVNGATFLVDGGLTASYVTPE